MTLVPPRVTSVEPVVSSMQRLDDENSSLAVTATYKHENNSTVEQQLRRTILEKKKYQEYIWILYQEKDTIGRPSYSSDVIISDIRS